MIKYNFNLEKLKKFFKLKRKDKNDGFTLVELVAVMAINTKVNLKKLI